MKVHQEDQLKKNSDCIYFDNRNDLLTVSNLLEYEKQIHEKQEKLTVKSHTQT